MTKDEADQALRTAIANHALAFGLSEPDELLGSYAVVAHWSKMENDGHSRYTTHFDSEEIPNHVAVGLFRVAEKLVGEEPE